jgi:hypothetical protein
MNDTTPEISAEQIEAAFAQEEPDTKGCLHSFRTRPVGMECEDGKTRFGVVARMVEHDEAGNPIVRDFVISADILAEMSNDIQGSVMTLGLIATLSQTGLPTEVLSMMLEDLGGIDMGDLVKDRTGDVPTPRGEIGS